MGCSYPNCWLWLHLYEGGDMDPLRSATKRRRTELPESKNELAGSLNQAALKLPTLPMN